MSPRDVAHILLTHIHLDHAGGTGALLREHPHIMVHVHESGAPHVIDPARLVSSALRIYGDALSRLFGNVLPVDAAQVRTLRGGETLAVGGHHIEVGYTPGHARHHVSYLDRNSGTAFIGDTGGIRNGMDGPAVPVTPPPDIDLELWSRSLDLISAWQPERLFLTHFGEIGDPQEHIAALRSAFFEWSERVRATLAAPGEDPARARSFAHDVATALRERCGAAAEWYVTGGDFASSWVGLARYLRAQQDRG